MRRRWLIPLILLSVFALPPERYLLAEMSSGTHDSAFWQHRNLRTMINAASSRYEVDPELVQAIVSVESAYDPLAVSPKGAMGLMQLMPETAARYGVSNPFNPRENVAGGIRYLQDLLHRFENLRHALAAYNAGEMAIVRYRGIPPYRETQNYVKRVIERYRPGESSYLSAAVLARGRRANELQRILRRARELSRASELDGNRRSRQAPRDGSAAISATRVRLPRVEFNHGTLVRIKRQSLTSVQLRAPRR